MALRDYYRILEVAPSATTTEIEAAFRRLARVWHPDRKPGDPTAESRMRILNEAREVLTDPIERMRFHGLRELALRQRAEAEAGSRVERRPNGRIAGLRPTRRQEESVILEDAPWKEAS